MTLGSWLMQYGGTMAAIATALLLSWLICPLWVLFSGRSSGGAKFGWFLITLFFSWIGFAVFLIVTQKTREKNGKPTFRSEPGFDG